ncbi:leucine-rich repeat-containing protein 45 [Sparus aurata]|uniref:Leucine rich repeat containing 45 n=1 Tax=Sparus aurata TaxID=8175 RepID=A0A671V2V4_SPAAU|nr:leucine-rich repeat-containing protein 45 [Sparus aurata]XP_030255941.1 leucine-rich repeat-containing protein 45 [Sparus aurata]XP_030255942.1 leucine-rich repeat-containing protein 45 [Sparus aurata]XP_030255943.1 leucine-rich repeat-containing protein 45 [Sparus aurata]XP_030255944.1 leucine-rich repeat-containing protein 45 [Sparus aurata]XP_030255946.1 leucine-rich repeat-containing protein 45 [Sparus aurata]
MEDFRRTYLRLCKDGGVEPQESVVAQLQENRAAQGSRLDLSGQSLSADTCSVLAKVLQKDTIFTEVSLSDCMLSEEGATVLLAGLFGNATVKVLDLKGNNLRSKGAEVLGRLLARNKTLRRLVLEWNALGVWEEAFSLFCEGLASNSVLTHLDLRNNQIHHHGASELGLALKHNNTLEALDLRWNNIGLLGGRSLLEALQKNQSIVQLEMAGNNIPSDTLRALEQTTGHNTDRQSTLRENRSRSQVLGKEIHKLKEEKGQQFLSLMETIDRQREEMGRSSRSTSAQIGQLQEALNERKSAVNSLTAKLQMTEAALALSDQKNHNMGELLTRVKAEKEDLRERQSRERKKEQEDSALREGKLLREIHNLTETNVQLRSKVEEMERRCKSQQQQIFDLKQELTNSTAELKLRLAQTEERLEIEKRRSKQALEDMDSLRQKEVEHVTRHLEESERALQERIFKMEGQRIQLEEELSKAKAACVTERAQAEEELGRVRTQVRLEEQEHVSTLEEKLRLVRSSLQEVQHHCSQQKQTISELQVKNSQQSIEMDSLRRRIEELQQGLSGKDQEKVAEVSRVRVELQEQIGHLHAERTAQGGLKEKISALEREIKVLSSSHREALLDKESEMTSMLEKLRLREAEIQRMREDEAQRASYLQSAILAYVQGSPLGHYSSPKK